jgi:hypothetical protein
MKQNFLFYGLLKTLQSFNGPQIKKVWETLQGKLIKKYFFYFFIFLFFYFLVFGFDRKKHSSHLCHPAGNQRTQP